MLAMTWMGRSQCRLVRRGCDIVQVKIIDHVSGGKVALGSLNESPGRRQWSY
jgi:hypothetical protein